MTDMNKIKTKQYIVYCQKLNLLLKYNLSIFDNRQYFFCCNFVIVLSLFLQILHISNFFLRSYFIFKFNNPYFFFYTIHINKVLSEVNFPREAKLRAKN